MKQYIYFIALLLLGVSCKQDFLVEDPKGVLNPDVFFSSDQIQLVADNLPASFSGIYSQAGCVAPFQGGDDLTTHPQSNKEKFREMDIFATSSVNDRIQLYWSSCYNTIRTANSLVDNSDNSSASQDVIDDVKGQAYFYRGLSYSFLTRIFGKVPLITKFDVNPDLTITKSEVAEIYAQIISDLKAAEVLLPNVRPEKSGDRGGFPGARPCKGTVKALLSQVYLTMAGWPLKQPANYALAAAKAKEVMDNSSTYDYQILPDVKDLWTWANNYTNKEVILGFYFNDVIDQLSMHGPLGPRPEEWINPRATWATGWCDYYAEISFFKRFPAGPRKDVTYQTIINVNGVDVPWDDARTKRQHPYFAKYQDESPTSSWAGSRTAQVIRYAEVVLNYAEAQAMANGADASAYNAVNTIRNRAGLPNLTQGLSKEAFRDSVIVERGWEFAGGEAPSRWFDLIRTETLEKVTLLRDPKEIPLSKQPTHDDYWLPIPGVDVSVNPNLK